MSSNGENEMTAVDALVDALMDHIDEAESGELEQLAGRGRDRSAIIAAARSAVERARIEIAQERRERLRERMRHAESITSPDVRHLSLSELRAIFADHVANDDASATMAARHEKGEMDEAELRAVVADILRLRPHE